MSRSAGVGLFAGGAQRTAASMRAPISRCPSPAATLSGRAARPHRYSDANSVSAAVAGEDPPRPVSPVRRGREADDGHARLRVPPAGDRAPPVAFGPEGPALGRGHLLAPADQPRAGAAHGLPCDQLVERACRGGQLPDVAGAARYGRPRRGRVTGQPVPGSTGLPASGPRRPHSPAPLPCPRPARLPLPASPPAGTSAPL